MTTVVGPLIEGPVYLSVIATAPPVQPLVVGGGATTHAVLETQSEQMGQPGQVAEPVAVICCVGEVPGMSQVTDALLHESFVGQDARLPGFVTVCPGVSVPMVMGYPESVVALFVHAVSLEKSVSFTTQFWSVPLPVFVMVMLNASVLSDWSWQVFDTDRPSHWKLAESEALATRFGFRSAEQKQLTVAVSGSFWASAVLQTWLFTSTPG